MQEFMARVEVLTRRLGSRAAPLHLDYGQLKIDLAQRRVQFRGEYIELTPQEFSLLYVLAQAEGTPLSRADLLRRACPRKLIIPGQLILMFSLCGKKSKPIPDNLI